jgi:3D-(3,5/4)-trihydroxycyclohexane-1,2-dione acylhydrolase (decyclizing)
MAQEIVTSLQENVKLNIVIFDNQGFSSIGGLSRACGSEGFGTKYQYRSQEHPNAAPPVDFVANASSLGAYAVRAQTREQFSAALTDVQKQPRTAVVVVETDYFDGVGGYESWWDVPIAEVSESDPVKQARIRYQEGKKKERYFWPSDR